MSVNVILDQLQDSYGKPNMMTLFKEDILFRSPMTPTNLPEMLFYRIKQCQEIQHIRKLPYSNDQIIANAVRILFQANIFPLKEFDMWERQPPRRTQPSRCSFMRCAGDASQQWH